MLSNLCKERSPASKMLTLGFFLYCPMIFGTEAVRAEIHSIALRVMCLP
jgi:hypothetical protein